MCLILSAGSGSMALKYFLKKMSRMSKSLGLILVKHDKANKKLLAAGSPNIVLCFAIS